MSVDVTLKPGETGQFDLVADGKLVVGRGGNWLTRKLGAGYPDFEEVVEQLRKHLT